MKKIIAMLLALVMVCALAACGGETTTAPTTEPTTAPTTQPSDPTDPTNATDPTAPTDPEFNPLAKDEGTMTYAEYAAAELDEAVVVECFVQATQGWYEKDGQGVITVYAQDPEGAYFMYNMACSQEDSTKLVPGTKIKVTGYKAAYKGEVEIVDCTFEIMEGNWIAEATDVTDLLASEDLINYQNMFAAIKNAKVVASVDANGNEVAFLYNWNGSGTPGNDLYFNIEVNGVVYNMCVESYLCGDGTAVYDAVEALTIGAMINIECFLYWYDTVNPHVTGVEVIG